MTEHVDVDVAVIGMRPGGEVAAGSLLAGGRRLGPEALVFPSPRGHWPRRSNYRRNTFAPWAAPAGWPRSADGRRAWTFHSLRHVFATWALAQPGARIEDVSRLLGHSTVRVTQTSTSLPTATCSSASTGRRRRGRGRTTPPRCPGARDLT
jgi:integrase